MLPELGLYALILALLLAGLQASIPLIGALKNSPSLMQCAKPLCLGQCAFIGFSAIILMHALISNDFSVLYVAENSNTHLALIFRISAFWGAHEGSMLLWVLILSGWSMLVIFFSPHLPPIFTARVLSVLGMISVGFLAFILFTSNPFMRAFNPVPIDGNDLNPLLQDIGLAVHPPILYMGYVGFAVPFAFAIAALIEGRAEHAWFCIVKRWTMAAWCLLTLGIILGSMWSYRVLGWGGWWAWDPVENASFMPWLCATALIHALIVSERSGKMKAWSILLALLCFSLSLLGTFLVRSGILSSVHAFAQDPSRGAYMLIFLALVVGGSLTLFIIRAPRLSQIAQLKLLSKESLLLSNNVILMVMMLTLLMGTLYPLFIDAFTLGKISVGPAYFNTVFIPLAIPLILLLGLSAVVSWRHLPMKAYLRALSPILMLCLMSAICLWFWFGQGHRLAIIGVVGGLWVILLSLKPLWHQISITGTTMPNRRLLSMLIAHSGVGVLIIAISLNMSFSSEKMLILTPGQPVKIGQDTYTLTAENTDKGQNYLAETVTITLSHQAQQPRPIIAAKKRFNVSGYVTSIAGIQSFLLHDSYISLGDKVNKHGAWSMRIYHNAFVKWIWLGGFLIILGGMVSLFTRIQRRREHGS